MDAWPTGGITANGVELHHRRTGGRKPAVILLHGLTANGGCWASLARALEAHHDVIMPDARGHGSSGHASSYTYRELSADVVALMDALALGPTSLVGHSMGGLTAAVVACEHPGRLRRLVLVDPTFLTPVREREVHESAALEEHLRAVSRSRADRLDELERRHPHRSKEILEMLADARPQTDPRAFEILKPPNPDYRDLVRGLALPTLLVFGGPGSVVSPEAAAALAALNPRMSVEQIKEAGHGLPYDQPDRFSTLVQAFLASDAS